VRTRTSIEDATIDVDVGGQIVRDFAAARRDSD
jgi:hypothetical protein